MIEKLPEYVKDPKYAKHPRYVAEWCARQKINELVDVVNILEEYNNLLFERIGEVNTKVAQLENGA